jgi:exodeoxyribonuclease V alpha subunit
MTIEVPTSSSGPGSGLDPGTDPFDARVAVGAAGLLRDFNRAGVLVAADVHVARRLGRLGGEDDQRVLLAAALAVRAVRLGAVCVALADAPATVVPDDGSRLDRTELAWPEHADWLDACAGSPLVATGDDDVAARPLRLVDGLLYLDRYWRDEELVRHELDARARRAVPVDADALRSALGSLFGDEAPDRQRLAAAMTGLRSITVLSGGPGTGKTTTVARLLALLRCLPGGPPRVALAAPTGKAAARMQEAIEDAAQRWGLDVGDARASTLHRLLGRRPDSRSRFRYDRHNRLPFDVVVVDETSMVSLSMMARLLEAVRPEARLVLVGDPDQLASVEAGAVLGDLVNRPAPTGAQVPEALAQLVGHDLQDGEESSDGLRNGVVRLTRSHRFGDAIGRVAAAVQADDPEQVLLELRTGGPEVELLELDAAAAPLVALRNDVVRAARGLVEAARTGDARAALGELDRHRLLCAHRRGPYGVARWTGEIERWLAQEGLTGDEEWYAGRPLLVTANDYELQLFNGDTGVVVEHPELGPMAAFNRAGEPLLLSPHRLSAVQTVHAMTVHRAQGSQFQRVTLLLPTGDSPLLTRELFYTALTRAEQHVRVVGTEVSVRLAVNRPIVRASGLRRARGRGSTSPGG